jgi:hypothetical protein
VPDDGKQEAIGLIRPIAYRSGPDHGKELVA